MGDARRYEIKQILENRKFWKKGIFPIRVQQAVFVLIILIFVGISNFCWNLTDESLDEFDKIRFTCYQAVLVIILILIVYNLYQNIVEETVKVAKEERKIVLEYVHNGPQGQV